MDIFQQPRQWTSQKYPRYCPMRKKNGEIFRENFVRFVSSPFTKWARTPEIGTSQTHS